LVRGYFEGSFKRHDLCIPTLADHKSKGAIAMSGKTDQAKGRVKEAAGAITDNDKLRREGKTDQAVGKVKEKVDKVADKVKKAVDGRG
jgi:uncharacterized protein YjbJ (UPF0337 family)